ncbi:hypothetical protein BDN67DRAFT_963026 [Paxillus ammoniavirescens]|nr:hypothetical protein BDN67DRAFT_963026 [Paxillus ammoniavirescens]
MELDPGVDRHAAQKLRRHQMIKRLGIIQIYWGSYALALKWRVKWTPLAAAQLLIPFYLGAATNSPSLMLPLEDRAGVDTIQIRGHETPLYSDRPLPALRFKYGGLNGPCVYVLDTVLYPHWDVYCPLRVSCTPLPFTMTFRRSPHSVEQPMSCVYKIPVILPNTTP